MLSQKPFFPKCLCPFSNLFRNIIYLALHIMSVLCVPFRKRLEQQQKMLEEDRKRRQFEEQKQKLRLLSSVKPKVSVSLHSLLFCYFHGMSTAHLCNPPGSWSSIVLHSDRREEPRWRLGGNQRQPGRLQQRREDAPHSVLTEQEARYRHLDTFSCNPWDFDPLHQQLCLRLRVITGLAAGQHDDCPAGSQTNQN